MKNEGRIEKLSQEQIQDLKNMIDYWMEKHIDLQRGTPKETFTAGLLGVLKDNIWKDLDSQNFRRKK